MVDLLLSRLMLPGPARVACERPAGAAVLMGEAPESGGEIEGHRESLRGQHPHPHQGERTRRLATEDRSRSWPISAADRTSQNRWPSRSTSPAGQAWFPTAFTIITP